MRIARRILFTYSIFYFLFCALCSVLYLVGIQYGRTLLQPLCPWVRTLTRIHFNQNAERNCAQHQVWNPQIEIGSCLVYPSRGSRGSSSQSSPGPCSLVGWFSGRFTSWFSGWFTSGRLKIARLAVYSFYKYSRDLHTSPSGVVPCILIIWRWR